MDPVIIGLLCGAVGLFTGVASMLAFRASERSRTVDLTVGEPTLAPGAAEVLSVVGRAYAVVDDVDGVVRANPAAYALGLVRGHSLVQDQLRELTRTVRADGVIVERRMELPRGPLGQSSLVVELRVAPLDEEYILILADDRTDVTRTEAMRHDFVVNVSHELKTPVGAISLLSEAIGDAAEDEEAVRRFAARLGVESRRLTALVQDIIEFSRLQAKDVVQDGGPVDLNAVVADAVDRLRLTAEDRGIALRVGGRVDAVVHGDQDQLMTAVRNLVDNAVRYSPEGTTVGIGLSSVDGLAQVTVTDQGIGISPEEQERVFERFYRVDAARSRQTGGHHGGHRPELRGRARPGHRHGPGHRHQSGGAGAGLRTLLPRGRGAVASDGRHGPGAEHRQARRHQPRRGGHPLVPAGPRVDLHHPPARVGGRCRRRRRAGCRPRHRAARSPGDRLGRTPDPEGDERMSRILIVEDEESFSDPLSYLLEKEGFEVTVAADGNEALSVFERDSADLILLDLMLPGMSGTEVCRQVRQRSNVPVIMLTAKDSEIDKVVGLELGADDYVTKPYSSRELVARVRAVLRRQGEQEEPMSATISAGPVRMDVERHVVSVDGEQVSLPLKEFELLEMLLRNAGRVLTRGQLIDRVWGSDYVGDTKTLDVHVKRLRSKIEPDPSSPRYLVTVRGLGYKFEA